MEKKSDSSGVKPDWFKWKMATLKFAFTPETRVYMEYVNFPRAQHLASLKYKLQNGMTGLDTIAEELGDLSLTTRPALQQRAIVFFNYLFSLPETESECKCKGLPFSSAVELV
jgi:hypothetical protein